MIRIVALLLLVVAGWLVLLQVARMLRNKNIDWTGVAFAAGFVILAFWLRGVTGIA